MGKLEPERWRKGSSRKATSGLYFFFSSCALSLLPLKLPLHAFLISTDGNKMDLKDQRKRQMGVMGGNDVPKSK